MQNAFFCAVVRHQRGVLTRSRVRLYWRPDGGPTGPPGLLHRPRRRSTPRSTWPCQWRHVTRQAHVDRNAPFPLPPHAATPLYLSVLTMSQVSVSGWPGGHMITRLRRNLVFQGFVWIFLAPFFFDSGTRTNIMGWSQLSSYSLTVNFEFSYLWTVLSDSATLSNLDTSHFLTVRDNIMFNPMFGMLSSRAIQNIPDMLGYL